MRLDHPTTRNLLPSPSSSPPAHEISSRSSRGLLLVISGLRDIAVMMVVVVLGCLVQHNIGITKLLSEVLYS